MILNGLLKCARHACFSSVAPARDPCSSQTAARGSSRVHPSWRDAPDPQVMSLGYVPWSCPPGRRVAPSVEHRDVDAAVEITFLERNPIGLMEQIGVEDHGPVGAMRNGERARSRLRQ